MYLIIRNFTGEIVASCNSYDKAQNLLDIFEATYNKTFHILLVDNK